MFYSIDVTPFGVLFLIIYVIIDFIRHKASNLLYRLLFYSFIIYLLFVLQYTTGGFHYPAREEFFGTVIVQLFPFQFVLDWIQIYQFRGTDWFFWNSVKLTLYNFVMLLPLGVYLVLFNKRSIKKAALIILFVSIVIETYQVVFSYFGLVFPRTFNVDDIILNTFGGVIGYYISQKVFKWWFSKIAERNVK